MSDVLTLISKPLPDIEAVRREVFCDVLPVNRYEFYTAQSVGILPSCIFSVFKYDFEGETRLEFDGNLYNVVRSYEKLNEQVELTCAAFELGQFNCKIKIFQPIKTNPASIFDPIEYILCGEFYAYKVENTGSEIEKESAIVSIEKIVFRFKKPPNFTISTLHEIEYNAKRYNITSVIPILGREEYVEVQTVSRA
ncbi:hypothetical protein FACS1894132_09720 [Clostridia bacterium]|nr:hypothetical protein FACS1894132_09720 [Clostridia bacterium]